MSVPTWSGMLRRWRESSEPAIQGAGGTWTGAELVARSAGAADWLDVVGAPPGGVIPALVSTSAAAIALVIGAAGSGRPLAPLNPRLTASELTACVGPLRSPVLVCDADAEDVARAVAVQTGARVAVLDVPSASTRPLDWDPPADAAAFVLHTSGTSGSPKPVPYRQDRTARRVEVHAELSALGPGSVFASASPFHHVAGWGNYAVALAVGAAVVPLPRFSVDAWAVLAEHGTTNALVVPTMIDMLLDAGALQASGVRILHYGASPIEPRTLARVLHLLPSTEFVNIFGQTEGTPITCLTREDHRRAAGGHRELLHSVGRAAPTVALRIEEPDEHGIGEVCARAPHLMQPDADGWLRTGDLGRLDADGYLYLVSRKGDRIVRGGENVYPPEVEGVIADHPGVAECAVVGVPDPRWGEVVRAVVVPADDRRVPDPEELRRHARARLAGFKVPTEWVVARELPRNAAGKLLRSQLRCFPKP